MKLNYFAQINPDHLQTYYHCQILFNHLPLDIDLNFEASVINKELLEKVNNYLDQIKTLFDITFLTLSHDYDLEDASEAVCDFLNHHLEVLDHQIISSFLGTSKITKEIFLEKLIIKRIGFYPEEEEAFISCLF